MDRLCAHCAAAERNSPDVTRLPDVKPCPHCRRKVRLSHKSDSLTFVRQSPFSATVWTELLASFTLTPVRVGLRVPLRRVIRTMCSYEWSVHGHSYKHKDL